MSFGKKIKKAREAMGLTQSELAQSIGVAPSAISNYENGVSIPRTKVLISLLSTLKVDANYIYGDYMETDKKRKLDSEEQNKFNQIRALDAYGKDLVYTVIEKEYQRVINNHKQET